MAPMLHIVARLAEIRAAKRTGALIPLCHRLPITGALVDFRFEGDELLHIEPSPRGAALYDGRH